VAAISAATSADVADGPSIVPPSRTPSTPSAMPASTLPPAGSMRRPVLSDLPPGTPLEPGLQARRMQAVANAFDRIAASEAANAGAGPGLRAKTSTKTDANPGGASPDAAPMRANFVAAARRAARAAASEHPPLPADKPAGNAQRRLRSNTLLRRVGPRSKSVILGVSAILLVLGALRPALDLFHNPDGTASPLSRIDDLVTPPDGVMMPDHTAALETPSPSASSRSASSTPSASSTSSATRNLAIFAGEIALRRLPASESDGTALAPISTAATSISAPSPAPDTTGSLAVRTSPSPGQQNRDASAPPAVPPHSPRRDLSPLPARIGGKALLDAAAAGEPGASYEIAIRLAEGRNVPQDLAQAATWFDRAARSGLAVAQFRLGSMYEKGLGMKQDLQEARRLYLAAADRGNAQAMHNLAVLYAEEPGTKPDFALASQWFRQAARFGLVDSQYNLALLYARGIGVERDLTQSYRWFALAAKAGDKDAAKVRDEIAVQLDSRSLESAKQAVEAFVAERQPGEATDTKAPPGGWDRLAAAAPAKRKAVH
jgi:localization factor PodJL